MKIFKILTLCMLIGVAAACRPIDSAEVMSEVTFKMIAPINEPIVQQSYQIKYLNHNTRVTTTRGSISTAQYQDQLLRGLYTIHVEGTLLLSNGQTIRMRGVEADQLFLDNIVECKVKLVQMP